MAEEDEFAGAARAGARSRGLPGLADASLASWKTPRVAELALAVERAALAADERVVCGRAGGLPRRLGAGRDRLLGRGGGSPGGPAAYAYLQALAEGDGGRETGLGFGLARGPGGLDPVAIGRGGG